MSTTLEDRFYAKTQLRLNGCIEWTAYCSPDGYGRFRVSANPDVVKMAHVVAWEMENGPVPKGKQLDHECHNTRCVNPDHLTPKTCLENVRNGVTHNAVKTHCKRGHELTGDNIKINGKGSRVCLRCREERNAQRREARRR